MRLPALFFGWVLLFFSVSSNGQEIFSDPDLQWYLRLKKGEAPAAPDSTIRIHTDKINKYLATGDLASLSLEHKELALIFLLSHLDYDQALDHLIEALTIEDSLQLENPRILTFLGIAGVFKGVGNFHKSAQYLEQAVDLSQLAGNLRLSIMSLNELGNTLLAMNNTAEASECFREALELTPSLDDRSLEATTLFNLAHLLETKEEYNKALEQHKRALAIWRSIRDKEKEAQSLNSIAELYRLMKNNDRSLANHVAALEIRRELSHKGHLAESYNNVAILYFEEQNYERALANLVLGLEAANESQAHLEMRKSYEYLSLCYEMIGDFENAYKYKKNLVSLNEFIHLEGSEQNLLEKQSRYEIEKREATINELEYARQLKEAQLDKQTKVRNFLFLFTALVCVILLLVVYSYVDKKRSNDKLRIAHSQLEVKNAELNDLNATKDKFFSIISHDLKGPLNSLTSFSGLLMNHTDAMTADEIKMLAKDLDKSLKNLFELLENLLDWSRSQTGKIEFTPEVFNLSDLLHSNIDLLTRQASNKGITLQTSAIDSHSVKAHKASVNTVIRNLISNAIKFTLPGGTVTVDIHEDGGMTTVSVTDTGVGMSDDVVRSLFRIDVKHTTAGTAKEKGTGLGLILCKEFMDKNSGSIDVTSRPGAGSVFSISLPAAVHVRAKQPV